MPDQIEAVPAVPRTLSGKKLEVPVKRILTGTAPDEAASRGAWPTPPPSTPTWASPTGRRERDRRGGFDRRGEFDRRRGLTGATSRPDHGPMRRRPLLALLASLALVVAGAVLLGAGPAGASLSAPEREAGVAQSGDPAADPDGDATTDDEPLPGGDIIPQPDSGVEPEDAGDRGGALQLTVFVVMLAGIALIVTLIVRESRKARRARTPAGRAAVTVAATAVSPAGRTPRSPGSRRRSPCAGRRSARTPSACPRPARRRRGSP